MRMHHQNADIGDLRSKHWPWRFGDLVITALFLGFVLGLYMVAQHADERDAEKATDYALAQKERLAMPTKIAEAYERGLNDAVEALRDTPNGVALAQACFAAGSK